MRSGGPWRGDGGSATARLTTCEREGVDPHEIPVGVPARARVLADDLDDGESPANMPDGKGTGTSPTPPPPPAAAPVTGPTPAPASEPGTIKGAAKP